MSTRYPPFSLVAVLLTLVVACAAREALPAVDEVDITLALQPDGTLRVREVWQVRASTTAASTFRRVIEPGHYDTLAFDGVDGGSARLGDATLVVESQIPAGAGAAHPVAFSYRAGGVLEVVGQQYRVTWRAIPGERDAAIARARLSLELPDTMTLRVPSGIAEAGWEVTTHPRGLTATRRDVSPGESGTVLAFVDAPSLRLREPDWQFFAMRARELTPAFLAAGLFLIVVAFGILLLLRWQARVHPAPPGPHPFARPLRDAGLVVIGFAVVLAIATELVLLRFGPAPRAVPISVAFCGVLFLLVALWIGPRRARRRRRAA